MTTEEIVMKLKRKEALVFFEWLSSIDSLETSIIQHSAEEKVLWKLHGQLESALHEPFLPNYTQIIEEARKYVISE